MKQINSIYYIALCFFLQFSYLNSAPLSFIENKGQWDPNIEYLASDKTSNIWFTDKSVVIDVFSFVNDNDLLKKTGQAVEMTFSYDGQIIVPENKYTAENRLPGYYNYFLGKDKTKWASRAGLFERIFLTDTKHGIKLIFYFDKGSLRFDLAAEPGTDPELLQIHINGATNIETNSHELSIHLDSGIISLGEIFAFQKIDNLTKPVECRYVLATTNTVSFSVSDYNRAEALVIDPIIYASYFGGSSNDEIKDIELDAQDNMIISGTTFSADFPATIGCYQESKSSGKDIFLSLISRNGLSLIWSTFIGGSGDDFNCGLGIDGSNTIYLAGHTQSLDYPTESALFEESSGMSDVYLSRISYDGANLLFSTYIGGSREDECNDIYISQSDYVFLVGSTNSLDYPTEIPYQEMLAGDKDIFVTQVNRNGSSLKFSTYLGGSSDDIGTSVMVSGADYVLIGGHTMSSDFPTVNPLQQNRGGKYDCIISKLNIYGDVLLSSTYWGGSNDDFCAQILTYGNSIYLAGTTQSVNLPVRSAYSAVNNGARDVFVSRFYPDMDNYYYSTYIGGSSNDECTSISCKADGAIYVSGFTTSSNFPIEMELQERNAGKRDIFLSRLSGEGQTLEFSTYIGGSSDDYTAQIFENGLGTLYLAATVNSDDMLTVSPLSAENAGGNDAFILKYEPEDNPVLNVNISGSLCQGAELILPFTTSYKLHSENSFTAELSDAAGSFQQPDTIGSINSNISGSMIVNIPMDVEESSNYRIRVSSDKPSATGLPSGYLKIAFLPIIELSKDSIVCEFNTDIYTANEDPDAINKWTASNGTFIGPDDQSQAEVLWGSSEEQGWIRLTRTTDDGCSDSVTMRIIIYPLPNPKIFGDKSPCRYSTQQYKAQVQDRLHNKWSVTGGTILGSSEQDSITVYWWGSRLDGRITVVQTDSLAGCVDSLSEVIIINPLPIAEITGPYRVCRNSSYEYSAVSDKDINCMWEVDGGEIISGKYNNNALVNWSGSVSGKLFLYYSDATTGCSDTATMQIDINDQPATPAVNGETLACLSNNYIYQAELSPDCAFSWVVKNGTITDFIDNESIAVKWDLTGDNAVFLTHTNVNSQCASFDTLAVKVIENPRLSFPADTINFGTIDGCMSSKTMSFEISNKTSNSISINDIYCSDAFSYVTPTLPLVLPGGTKKSITIRFSSNSAGITYGTAYFVTGPCNDIDSVELVGNKAELTVYADKSNIDFGQLIYCGNETKDTSLIVYNAGTESLIIDDIAVALPFECMNKNFPYTVRPDTSILINIRTDVASIGIHQDDLKIAYHTGSCSDTLRILLRTENISPELSLMVNSLSFPKLLGCETHRDTTITLTNKSNIEITLSDFISSKNFSCTPAPPFVIDANNERDIVISFLPDSNGVFSNKAAFRYDPCNKMTELVLSGEKEGVSYETPDSVNFGTVDLDNPASFSKEFKISNMSASAQCQVKSVHISGPFSSDLDSGTIINSSEHKTFTVTFDPTQQIDGEYTGYIDLILDPCNIEKRIHLSAMINTKCIQAGDDIYFPSLFPGRSDDDTAYFYCSEGLCRFDSIESSLPDVFEILGTNFDSFTEFDTLQVYVKYTPISGEETAQILIHSDTDTCGLLELHGSGFKELPFAKIEIGSASANSGDTVTIPINIVRSSNLAGISSFSARLSYNKTLLWPLNSPLGYRVGNMRFSVIEFALDDTVGTVGELKFIAAWGDDSCSSIILDSLVWSDTAAYEIQSGTFCLNDICREGGARFFQPEILIKNFTVSPNPSNSEILVKYELLQQNSVSLNLSDNLGNRHYFCNHKAQSAGEHSHRLDISEFSTGIYYLMLETETLTEVKILRLIK